MEVQIKYDESWYRKLINHLGEGLSLESFAGVIEVTQLELRRLIADNPAMQKAVSIGNEKARLWWEKQSIIALGDKFESGLWQFNMVNKFGWSTQPKDSLMVEEITVKLTPRVKATMEFNESLFQLPMEQIEDILQKRHINKVVEKKIKTKDKLNALKSASEQAKAAPVVVKKTGRITKSTISQEELAKLGL